jgi:3'(2'), 5'-bisphosphate nucleotidase
VSSATRRPDIGLQSDPFSRDLETATAIVQMAATLARDIRRSFGDQVLSKADRSPVTVADFAVQAFVASRLAETRPGDPLVAEEDAAALRTAEGSAMLGGVTAALANVLPGTSADDVLRAIDRGGGETGDRFWTLDPIDGTQGFIRGDQYVVALALIVNSRVEVGVLGCPELALGGHTRRGIIAAARRGHGAFRLWLDGTERRRLAVRPTEDARELGVLRSLEDGHVDLPAFTAVVESLGITAPPIRMDSQAKHAVLAAGEGDLLLRLTAPGYHEKIWDQAVGSLLIEEAGGRVTDAIGQPLDFSAGRTLARNRGVIASNGRVHAAVIDALGRYADARQPI